MVTARISLGLSAAIALGPNPNAVKASTAATADDVRLFTMVASR
jgi:hypothetical protein